jgi:hypothetical protein
LDYSLFRGFRKQSDAIAPSTFAFYTGIINPDREKHFGRDIEATADERRHKPTRAKNQFDISVSISQRESAVQHVQKIRRNRELVSLPTDDIEMLIIAEK